MNVGGGHRVSLLEALDTLGEVTGLKPDLRMMPSERGDARDTWADLSRVRAFLVYAPSVSLRDGLAAEWEWIVGRSYRLSTPHAD